MGLVTITRTAASQHLWLHMWSYPELDELLDGDDTSQVNTGAAGWA